MPMPTRQDFINGKEDLDALGEMVNSPDDKLVDTRFGGLKRTLANWEARWAEAIANAGGVPIGDGVYSAGKQYTNYNQYLVDAGTPYRCVTIPYTVDVSGYPNAAVDPNLRPWVFPGLSINGVVYRDTIEAVTLIGAAVVAEGQVFIVGAGPGTGNWRATGGDISGQVASDPLGGVYRPWSGTDGSSGGVVRFGFDFVTPEMFGAVGDWDGTTGTDDTAAFRAALAYLEASARTDANYSWKLYTHSLKLRGTSYLLTGDGVLDFAITAQGLSISGDELQSTAIEYQPAGANYALIRNDDKVARSSIKHLSVNCSGVNAATARFMDVVSQDSVYGWDFERVSITGSWENGWVIDGPNLGSEFHWKRCRWGSGVTFATDGAGVLIPATASDQMVNYTFEQCDFGIANGHAIRADKGGSITINGGTWTAWATRTNQGYIVYLPTGDHSSGAQRLSIAGVRYEPKPHQLMGLVYSRWKSGTILISDFHDDIHAFAEGWDANTAMIDIGWANAAGPKVEWNGCVLAGAHAYYPSGSESWRAPHNISYVNCDIREHESLDTFIKTDASGVNASTVPFVQAIRCKFKTSSLVNAQVDQVNRQNLNWNRSSANVDVGQVLHNRSYDGKAIPSTTGNKVLFPPNTLLRSASLIIPAGQYANTAPKNITISTNEATPRTLATFAVANLSLGHKETININELLLDDESRLVTCVSDGTDTRPADVGGCALIFEYCG